jgi:hypothetical protein
MPAFYDLAGTSRAPAVSSATRLPMRCYFHLVSGEEAIMDDTGIEVADIETAQREALKAIQEMRQEAPDADEDWQNWRLNVVDQSGNVLLSIRLDTPLP